MPTKHRAASNGWLAGAMVVCGMTAKLLAITILALAATSCGRSEWPEPRLEFYHANTEAQAKAYAYKEAAAHGWHVNLVAYTGSMRPYINGGEYVVVEPYAGQQFPNGTVLTFNRDPAARNVLHTVADQNGRAVYMSGAANKYSDGWIPRERIHGICRLVVTYPRGAKTNASYP